MIRIDRKVLDIEKVLQMGMTFRWHKNEDSWEGVIGRNAFRLQQVDEGIKYSLLNLTEKNNDALIEQQLRQFFDLDRDYKISNDDKNMLEAIATYDGIRQLQLDPVETLFSFICSSNNHISRISSMMVYLGRKGPLLVCGPVDLHQFPDIKTLAALTEKELREAQFGYRAKYIVKTAQMILENGGDAWVEELQNQDYDVAVQKLMTLSGIGRKVADCIALYGLNKRQAIPLDVHLIRIANRDYGLREAEKGLTPARYNSIVARLRETWGEDSGYVQTVLFFKELQLAKAKKGVGKRKPKKETTDVKLEQESLPKRGRQCAKKSPEEKKLKTEGRRRSKSSRRLEF